MGEHFGPHQIVGSAELFGTLGVLGMFFVVMCWMAYNVRWKADHAGH